MQYDHQKEDMDVALDSNVIIRDLWFRSQQSRLLLDYLDRTCSQLIIGEIVIQEVDAYFKRMIERDLATIEGSLRTGKQHFLDDLPDIASQEISHKTYAKWRNIFDFITRKGSAIIYV
jgi:predicted nucleic acid-binding protein